MNDNTKKNVVAGMSQEEVSQLADRIAGDIGVSDDLGVQAIAGFIAEYQDELDLSDYDATFEFMLDLWEMYSI
jgi:hypothetical protein|tara:strand:+ start:285 stop:503 length:219 start_codon:yes stop_codon:yes gene_type:complete